MDSLEANIMDKSMRSVFVGNIPYEATEEKLKDIFGEVGQVLSFKLVFDRETGKPKGYGFCEYRDQETALSAMRNLNGYEIGGRNLRVDNACTEKSRMEMQNLLNQPPVENPYGDPIQADKAPEAISKAVASLPPEQMFELMKQMKFCIQNNPSEARQMLLQNPQLAYALLQAQVVMKIIDPHIAAGLLHPSTSTPLLNMTPNEAPISGPIPINNAYSNPPTQPSQSRQTLDFQPPQSFISQDIDLRSVVDPRMTKIGDQDLRSATLPNLLPPSVAENFNNSNNRDPRASTLITSAVPAFSSDPRTSTFNAGAAARIDPRQKIVVAPQPLPVRPPSVVAPPRAAPVVILPPTSVQAAAAAPNVGPAGASDQEKAALIMQVLQLSDEQIAMLPMEQRSSILMLKEQIAKSANRAT